MNTPGHHQQHRHQHHQLQEDRQPAARDLLVHEIRAAIARATTVSPLGVEAGTAEPLAGVRAARLARDVAAGQLREQALRARGAGHGWDEIADALGLTHDHEGRDDEGCGQQLGELAWEWLIEHRPPPPDGRRGMAGSAVWVCTACRARVRDTGPYACHPDDRETGHTPDCPRHRAALAAHLHELNDHDDTDDRDDRDDRDDAELDPANDITARRRGGALLEEGNG